MKTYQVEIKETLSMTIEIEAENAQQAEEMIREAYGNQEYILDAEHFTGVDFSTKEKEIDTRSRNQKHNGQERRPPVLSFSASKSENNHTPYSNIKPVSYVGASTEFGYPNSLVRGFCP